MQFNKPDPDLQDKDFLNPKETILQVDKDKVLLWLNLDNSLWVRLLRTTKQNDTPTLNGILGFKTFRLD